MKTTLFLPVLLLASILISCGKDNNDIVTPVEPPVVVAVKPSVSTLSASKIGLTTVTISGNVTSEGGASIDSRGVVYGTDSTKLDNTSNHLIVPGTTGTITADLTGLSKNTVYYAKAFASNKAGISYGFAVKFWTYDVLDCDNNGYHTVKIGSQTWMVENFRGNHFADGTLIPTVTDQSVWKISTSIAMCYYDNKSENGLILGGLYNFYVASNSRQLVKGWHVPVIDEWNTLYSYAKTTYGPDDGHIICAASSLRASAPLWTGRNDTGFSAVPGGCRGGDDGGVTGFLWGGKEMDLWINTICPINPDLATVIGFSYSPTTAYDGKAAGNSIRLIQD